MQKNQKELITQYADELIRECFWEYEINAEKISAILESNNFVEKRFIFNKIFTNSTNVLKTLEIFSRCDLKQFLDDFTINGYNHDYYSRKRDIVRNLLLNELVTVKGLEWVT
jgi:hypothetical protein